MSPRPCRSREASVPAISQSPRKAALLMYCHEGRQWKLDRIWLLRVDGRSPPRLVHQRTMKMEITVDVPISARTDPQSGQRGQTRSIRHELALINDFTEDTFTVFPPPCRHRVRLIIPAAIASLFTGSS